jgi:hypothetical protein
MTSNFQSELKSGLLNYGATAGVLSSRVDGGLYALEENDKAKRKNHSKKSKRKNRYKDAIIKEKDNQIKKLGESLLKAKEEQFEFDQKMQQVTNLLKELKNNSSSGGNYNSANTGAPYDEKSLKLQDLEKTTS